MSRQKLNWFEAIGSNPPNLLRNYLAIIVIIFLGFLLVGCGFDDDDEQDTPYQPATGTRTLNISPIAQQSEVWCWAASAEMVFRYYGLPNINPSGNYQCGIVAAHYGPASSCWINCFTCISAIGPISLMQSLIDKYGFVAGQYFPSNVLSSKLIFSALTFNNTAREIDRGRPIIAGISPNGYSYPNISQHAVVIIGYQNDADNKRIIINDPFPYDDFITPNPYTSAGGVRLSAGQYSIPYTVLVSSIQWGNTIYQIR